MTTEAQLKEAKALIEEARALGVKPGLNGKHNGACECQCGGKNHGAGMFTRLMEAA